MMMQGNHLQEKFLEDFTKQLFPSSQASENQKLFCKLRFHPQHWDKGHTQVVERLNELLNGSFPNQNISGTLQQVVKKIKERWGDVMEADGVDIELLHGDRGRPSQQEDSKSPWKTAYHWLWEIEFPRRGWQLAKDMAGCAMDELQMIPFNQLEAMQERERGLDLDEIESAEDTIEKGERYGLEIKFLQQEGYLLLVNEGTSPEKYCICPSRAYHLQPQLSLQESLYLPGRNASAKSLRFTEVGDEYFLAIVTDKPLNLSWVRPDGDARDLAIDDQRMREIFQQLGRLERCQVFYKKFAVRD